MRTGAEAGGGGGQCPRVPPTPQLPQPGVSLRRGGRRAEAAPCRGSARRRRTCRVRAGGRGQGRPGLGPSRSVAGVREAVRPPLSSSLPRCPPACAAAGGAAALRGGAALRRAAGPPPSRACPEAGRGGEGGRAAALPSLAGRGRFAGGEAAGQRPAGIKAPEARLPPRVRAAPRRLGARAVCPSAGPGLGDAPVPVGACPERAGETWRAVPGQPPSVRGGFFYPSAVPVPQPGSRCSLNRPQSFLVAQGDEDSGGRAGQV